MKYKRMWLSRGFIYYVVLPKVSTKPTTIGTVKPTGNSTSSHLQFEIL